MRTPTTSWILVLAALSAVACGDDTGANTTSSSSNNEGGGGSSGDGGGATTGTTTSTSSSTTTSTSATSSTGSGDGGAGGTGGGAECGNGVIDGNEVCDGDDLGDATCEGEGFVGGDLACNATCDGLVTAACVTCGDGVADGNDECDGDDLGTGTCQTEGFDAGTLGCNADCTYDTGACVDFTCGDGERNGNEDCEGDDLGTGTCESEGFSLGGDLGCTATCQYDVSGCNSCGDGVINGNDVCDGAALGAATCASVGDYTGGVLACAGDCSGFDESGCTNLPAPAAGQVIINEIMYDPGPPSTDPTNEWIELRNTTDQALQLAGCTISDNAGTFTLAGDLTIAPNGFFTMARTGSTAFTPDTFYGTLQLGNSGDILTLTCNGVPIDVVDYDGFVDPAGASIQLDPSAGDAAANDLAANWCASTVNVGLSTPDLGTPGTENLPCGGGATSSTGGGEGGAGGAGGAGGGGGEGGGGEIIPVEIGFCRLQAPATLDGQTGTEVQVFGRVYVEGVTDQSTGNDPYAGLIGEVGYGADGSDPAVATWTWLEADPNPAYGPGSPDAEANNDEYFATFALPGPGGSPYDYAFRFSGDGGLTWTYCDLDGNDGSVGGYSPDQAGAMTTEAPEGGVFISTYVEGSSNNKAIEIYNAGSAAVSIASCSIRQYNNGSGTAGTALTLADTNGDGMLDTGETFVVCNQAEAEITDALCNQRAPNGVPMNFNGNDAIELTCGGVVVDVFGQIGNDPGTGGWPAGTTDAVLVRQCDVFVGDPDGSDEFVTAEEWDRTEYSAAAANTELGNHTLLCDGD